MIDIKKILEEFGQVKKFDGETTLRWFEMDRDVRCLQTKLQRLPLDSKVDNMNTNTHLLSKKATNITRKLQMHWNLKENINSVCKLLNTEQVIGWNHAAA